MSGRGPRGRARTRSEMNAAVPQSEIAETGRGRGVIQGTEAASEAPQAGRSPTSSGGSPTSSSNEPSRDSPPQIQPALGRAAIRGRTGQPIGIIESEIIDPLARMSLQQRQQEAEERTFIGSVPITRPADCKDKRGTSGIAVPLMANYFEIIRKPDWVLYQYHVDFDPPIESRKMRLALVHLHNDLFPQNKAFDGSTLFTATRLADDPTVRTSTAQRENKLIKITFTKTNEVIPTSPEFVHLLNIVFRRCLQLYEMTQIGRDYYDLRNPMHVQKYNLDIVNGFATAISVHESKLLLCAEVSHKVMHSNNLYGIMDTIIRKNPQYGREEIIGKIVGQVVMTKYNNKTYRVDDINWEESPRCEFETSNGTRVSFIDYYREHYNINIQDPGQPLLMSKPKERDRRRGSNKPVLLIPELCILTGLSDSMREDTMMMRELASTTRVNPLGRAQRLSDFLKNLNQNTKVNTELDKWKLKFDTVPIQLEGRRFDTETLSFGNNNHRKLQKADWTNDMKNARHLLPIQFNKWLIFYSSRDEDLAFAFFEKLKAVARPMGINIADPDAIAIPEDKTDYFIKAIKTNVRDDHQIAVFVLGSNRKDRYDAIKKQCCLDLAIPSQVILGKNLRDQKKVMGVMTKVAVQMNCKLGGEIWSVEIPIKNVMICGIDTYHDSMNKNLSVCAFVATANQAKTKFFSRATLQASRQELSSNLTISMKSALEYYSKINNSLPDRIIVYRDGISDGELPIVKAHEVKQIIDSFAFIAGDYKPRFAFIIVKKRGNARFFQEENREVVNPEYGTVIDTCVTREEWYDFYLISQQTTQGTVNPTHYNVIEDTTGLKPDHFQRLTHKLTHMYYNWSGTIRVPALCQYAHKLAFLVGQSLHKEHHISLSDKLYYL